MRLIHGDCREEIRALIDSGVRVHSVVTDPPYALTTVDRFGKDGAAPAKHYKDGAYARQSQKFMGFTWDTGEVAFDADFWRLIHDVLLPGGFVCAFASPRTGHRQASAMEEAGLTMHPMVAWTYSSGMPKAHSVARSIGDPEAGAAWQGWHYGLQALKPALEPIYVAQRPFSERTGGLNVLSHGVGGMNIDACRPGARWPANLMHDGSADVVAALGESAQHFSVFHHPKANREDRAGSKHPTVKPVALIQHLIRLVTPPGGVVLDPFAGSGTTGEAALREGAEVILIEREPQFFADIERRFGATRPLVAEYFDLLGVGSGP
jgi:site-specific DNA-methyltransferase (adenine-specific)